MHICTAAISVIFSLRRSQRHAPACTFCSLSSHVQQRRHEPHGDRIRHGRERGERRGSTGRSERRGGDELTERLIHGSHARRHRGNAVGGGGRLRGGDATVRRLSTIGGTRSGARAGSHSRGGEPGQRAERSRVENTTDEARQIQTEGTQRATRIEVGAECKRTTTERGRRRAGAPATKAKGGEWVGATQRARTTRR